MKVSEEKEKSSEHTQTSGTRLTERKILLNAL